MRLWRIERQLHADEALSGEGARRYGGRWNRPHAAIVYLSTSLALAAHEKFVHAAQVDRHIALVALCFEIQDEASISRPRELPADWRAASVSPSTQAWGSHWERTSRSALASVPSVLLPLDLWRHGGEHNVLLAPHRLSSIKLREVARLPFAFDPRSWKGAG